MIQRVTGMAGLIAVFACLAQAYQVSAEDNTKNKDSQTDQQFVQKASAIDLAEINLGNLAARLGSSDQVKQFGQHMVADHTKSSRMLTAIVDRKQLKSATTMDKKHQALFDKLKTLNGADFDKEYMRNMAMGHKEAVDLYRQEAKQGKDEDLKTFAQSTLPTIESHLKMAQDVANKLGVDKGEKSQTER